MRRTHSTLLLFLWLAGCTAGEPTDKDLVRDRLEQGEVDGDPCAEEGYYEDGVCDDWCPEPDPECDAAQEPLSLCEAEGFTCAPFGPVAEGFGCPEGTHGVAELSCSVPGGPVVEEVCCAPDEEPPPPPEPELSPCEAEGFECAPFGPVSEGYGCPEGTEVIEELSCSTSVGASERICCAPIEEPREPADTQCEAAGFMCAPYGPASEGFGCPEGWHGTLDLQCNPAAEEICCVPDQDPEPEPEPQFECERAGFMCAPYGPASEGYGCPEGWHGTYELGCNPGAEEVCCVPDQDPEPEPSPCEAEGFMCAPYGPASEGYGCPEGTQATMHSCSSPDGPVTEEVCCAPATMS